jgi:hypothetical protein
MAYKIKRGTEASIFFSHVNACDMPAQLKSLLTYQKGKLKFLVENEEVVERLGFRTTLFFWS